MIVCGPFEELELPDQFRPDPATFPHLFGRKACSPASALRLWQVRERARRRFQRSETAKEVRARAGRESIARARDVQQPVSFVIPEDQRIETPNAGRVSANDKFLAVIDSHLPPGARA